MTNAKPKSYGSLPSSPNNRVRRRKNPELVLPSHVLESTFQRLPLQDLVRIKAVSSTWKSCAEVILLSRSYLQRVPWLMFPPTKEAEFDCDESDDDDSCRLMNVEENIVYDLKKTTLDLVYKFVCIGSSHGWLIFFDDTTQSPFLLNPFTEHRIQLPSLEPLLKRVKRSILRAVKAILTAEPDGEYGVVVLCDLGIGLGFYKNGDSFWTEIEGSSRYYDDIICCKNQLYALRYSLKGVVDAWDLHGYHPKKNITIAADHPDISDEDDEADDCTLSSYLVESRGEILLVVRLIKGEEYLSNSAYRTKLFHVYKLDIKRKKWVEVKSLRDQCLFLGINHSTSISTEDLQTCKPNSIYFTDDFWVQILHSPYGHDMGIYCLEDGCFSPVQDHLELPEETRPSLCWIVPNRYNQIQSI